MVSPFWISEVGRVRLLGSAAYDDGRLILRDGSTKSAGREQLIRTPEPKRHDGKPVMSSFSWRQPVSHLSEYRYV